MRDLTALPDLKLALVQTAPVWQDPAANHAHFGRLLEQAADADLVILPEMFSTGFSMDAAALAEEADGPSRAWLLAQAARLGAVVVGSVITHATDGSYRNRLYWARPDGSCAHYDKRHLFRMAGEHEHYAAGQARVLLELKGWHVRPLVCYDLRFPVYSRNRFDVERAGMLDYDLLIYVANWPSARNHAWKTLLRARAIENQCYVAGVNRVGTDGNGLHYNGESAAIDYLGNPLSEATGEEVVATALLQAAPLLEFRQHFPAMLDADAFTLDP